MQEIVTAINTITFNNAKILTFYDNVLINPDSHVGYQECYKKETDIQYYFTQDTFIEGCADGDDPDNYLPDLVIIKCYNTQYSTEFDYDNLIEIIETED